MTKTEAAIRAGFPESVARSHPERIFRDPDTQAYIRDLATEEGMDARVWVRRTINMTEAQEIVFLHDGSWRERPDNKARLRALRLIGEACGYIKPSVNVVAIVQAVSDNLVELVMPFIPKDKHGEFFAEAKRRFGPGRISA